MEGTILTSIDIEVDEFRWFLIAPLHIRTEWDNGSLTDKDGNLFVWCIDNEALTSLDVLIGIEVIPTTLFWKIDATITSLVITNRTCHQGRTEHPLVADILYFLVTVKVHHQGTHQGIVPEMSPTCHRIEVRHQAIAQLVIIDERLISRMLIRSNIPNLTQRPLTMTAEKGNEGTKLVPTCLQLTPLFQVFVLLTCAVEKLLGCHIAVLHTETALVHTPEGDTGNRVVESCRHLGTHILPTGSDITTPRSGGETLLPSKSTASQQEHSRLIGLPLPN